MAAVTSVWFLCILMVDCTFFIEGLLVTLSPPKCYIPCDDSSCSADIICTWDSNHDPSISLNNTYTLHWEDYKNTVTGHSAVIQRNYFTSHSELRVWIQTQDQDGTVFNSKTVSFNTADIIKPSPPEIKEVLSSQEPIEIHWRSPCDWLMLEVGHCEVRHRTEAETAWTEQKEGGVSGSYTLNNPEPCTNYSFQVRCACGTSMMSGWSKVHVIRSAERAPIGKLDIWRDCDMLRPSSNCVLTWKRLPMSQARGHILGYNLTLYYNNGTNSVLNMSAAESVCMICNEVQCYHNSSLKDVKFVSFNAYNALGMTAPSHLAVQTPVTITDQRAIDLKMNRNNLSVSWNATWITDNISEFVVQYKEAGSPLGKGLDWVRVNTSLTKITVKGQFKNYTAYQVSVFTVSDHMVQLYCTDIIHFVQGIPAKVPLFKVLTYGTTHVTLLWETVLMSVHNGVTPYYQIGYGKDNVYNVSAYPQMENRTFTLTNLTEDHNYKVWIKAVNQAGSGPNTTVLFKTQDTENIGTFIQLFFVLLGAGLLLCCSWFCRKNKTCPIAFLDKKIPDPHNSNIIREMKYQINDSLAWLCIPATEQHPKMSIIEIVNISQGAFTSKMADQMNCDIGDNIVEEGRQKTQCGSGKEEYSKMIDSDEDKNEEEEDNDTCSSSSGGDHAGYEQHFMPTELDIKAVEERERTERSWDEMM
ncbi:interleukin 12 receptor, beta 2a, like [Periophthalmus magnuspinnatus]|uniref:interleukin 12 receptor, beta 2a, like n=1 Tax=Periophthalmus magnuspinnatus TaxID=409849 RepID=UPI00145B71B7|nr:interleukin 12 receptor, beta 2a, like [Periophthalmus magnuspinnatus]